MSTPTTEDLLATLNQPLPWCEEAEKTVLCSLIQAPARLMDEALADIPAAAFYNVIHALFYDTLGKMWRKGMAIDPGSLISVLRDQKKLEEAGGPAFVTEIATFGHYHPTVFAMHRQRLMEKYRQRRLIGAFSEGLHLLQSHGASLDDDLLTTQEKAKELLNAVETDDGSPELPFRPISQILDTVLDRAEYRATHVGTLPGVSTGFRRLDELTGGMQRGRFWTILAESSEGKSSLCRQFVEAACEAGHAGVIYTYEMMDDEEAARLICSQGVVSSDTMKTGLFSRAQQEGLGAAIHKIKGWDIAIVDVAGRCIEDIWRDIARRKKRLKPGQELVVMIDYIQLAKTREKFPKQRQQQIAYISGGSKQCAKTNQCTILMPSQVNKDGDAREGMDIEQDCDVKIMIRRPGQDKKNGKKVQPWDAADDQDEVAKAKRELFLGKNRDGPKNEGVKARMIGHHFRFEPDYM